MMPPLRTLKIANSAILSYNPRNLLEKRFQTRNRITNHDLQKKLSRDTRPLFGISYHRLLYWCGSGRLLIALRDPQEGGHSAHLPTTRAYAGQSIAHKSA